LSLSLPTQEMATKAGSLLLQQISGEIDKADIRLYFCIKASYTPIVKENLIQRKKER